MEKPKFGDKSIGRTSIERLIIFLEAYNLSRPVITLIVLTFIVGINTIIHKDYSSGLIFLLLVYLILISGNKVAENFFGSSALAIFITLHISLFGFKAFPLILSFVLFIIFRKILSENLLYPISVYLLIDSIFNYFNIETYITRITDLIGKKVFTINILSFLAVIPIVYTYLVIERYFKNKFSNLLIKNYGVYYLFCFFVYVFIIIGIIIKIKVLVNIGTIFMILYIVGISHLKSNIKKFFIAIIPIVLLLFILSFIHLVTQ